MVTVININDNSDRKGTDHTFGTFFPESLHIEFSERGIQQIKNM